jgi:ketosteroid isomerase-like protein
MLTNVEIVRRGWHAAQEGDIEAVAGMLAEDIRWHAAGDDEGGCRNRAQALEWMSAAIARGAGASVLELRDLDDQRVLVVLQRPDAIEPHAQVVTIRDGKIAEIVVHATPADALAPSER